MNPEENNPLANPGVPNFGVSNGQINIPGNDQAMSDNLSMAGDSLTAAGMAAGPTIPGPVSFNQSDPISNSEANFTPAEEPLVPADPVPGSIGSVTSVPAEPLSNPFAPADDVATLSGAMPAPEIQPQAAPYNPFAQPAAEATSSTPAPEPAKPFMTPAKDTVNPAFQPAPTPVKTKTAQSMSPLTAILAVACALLLITTIIFMALFINAKNNPKVVYVPAVSDSESNSQIKFLTCSQNAEMNWLVNDAYSVPATRTLSMTYSGEKISGINDEVQATFISDEDAVAGRDIFESMAMLTFPAGSSIQYNLNGNVMNVAAEPEASPLTEEIAAAYIYGSEVDSQTTSLSDVQGYLELSGYVCTVE